VAEPELQIEIRQIEPGDRFAGFSVGDGKFLALKIFLQKHARRFQDQNLARTYGAFARAAPQKLLAYVTLVCGEVVLQDADPRLINDDAYRYSQYPAVKIARLAVDSRYRGANIGVSLVDLSLGIAKDQICPAVGCRFVMVDSKPESIGFYSKCGFSILQTPTNLALAKRVMYVDLLRTMTPAPSA
jgi:ribosomal protein S18 acetylase RimI-like enzyme